MKRLSPLALILLAALACAGCSHIPFIGKKSAPKARKDPKESSLVATETEKEFEQRWVEKRAIELISQGQTSEAARAQALGEFKHRFAALPIAQQ